MLGISSYGTQLFVEHPALSHELRQIPVTLRKSCLSLDLECPPMAHGLKASSPDCDATGRWWILKEAGSVGRKVGPGRCAIDGDMGPQPLTVSLFAS
jgi:hypothetical protein